MPHRDPVIHPDGVELKRNAACLADRFFDQPAEGLQVDVAGDDINIGIDDCDERLVHVFIADTGCLQQGAVWCSFDDSFHLI